MSNEDKKKQNAQIQEALMGMMDKVPSPDSSSPETLGVPEPESVSEPIEKVDASEIPESASAESSEKTVGDSDNIDQIMNEIEGLRKDMKNTVSGSKNPKTSNATTRSPEDFEPALAPELDVAETGVTAVPKAVAPSAPSAVGQTSAAHGSGIGTGTGGPMAVSDTDPSLMSAGMPEEAWLQETYANLKDSQTESHEMGHGLSGHEGSLTLLVQGAITVKLRHEDSMQEVGVSFGSESIHVFLADGAELHLPIRSRRPGASGSAKKRAA